MIKRIGNEAVYAVVSPVGATVHEFVVNGNNIIFQPRPVGDKSRGGIPICFPFFSSPPESMSDIPKHGWLRHEELRLVEESDIHVVFEGENEKRESYPWKLKYRITISISSLMKQLRLRLVTTRLDDGCDLRAPINPGFHPYFCSKIDDPIVKCIAKVGSQAVTDFRKESRLVFAEYPILIRSGDQTVQMALDGDFDAYSMLTLWSDDPERYFCVEPIPGHPGNFNVPSTGRFLREGEEFELICVLTML